MFQHDTVPTRHARTDWIHIVYQLKLELTSISLNRVVESKNTNIVYVSNVMSSTRADY